jgi:hypothetical protein
MTTRKAHAVYYAESFCSLSETYVYRTAQCLSAIVPTTILTHDRNHRDVFPDAALDIWVEPQTSSGVRRVSASWRAWFVCGKLQGVNFVTASPAGESVEHRFGDVPG